MRSLHDLVEMFAALPGIGPRQARRIVQFLLLKEQGFRKKFADSLADIGRNVSSCPWCFRFDEIPEGKLCRLCSDASRDHRVLMVVEKDVDIEGIENSGAYRGFYFVLGGLVPLGRKKKSAALPRVKELTDRVKKNGITEIIFALSTTPEGDYTAEELLREITTKHPGVKATLLGRGLSVGAEIEYADQETLRNAFKNRS